MIYIPNHLNLRQENTNKSIHKILYDYFSCEIEQLQLLHSTWLKYSIIENKNMFYLFCKENDKKIKYLHEDFPNIIFVEKRYINKLNNIDGIKYIFKI